MTSSGEVGGSVPAAGAAAADEQVRESVLELDGPLSLYHGGALTNVRVAWRLAGRTDAPIVVALGGISAHRTVFSSNQATVAGWWDSAVGPGRALDTRRVRVLGLDYLGGSGETTGPEPGAGDFPSISAFDQAELLERVRKHLAISVFAGIAGASYGGMVALAYASRWPQNVRRLVVISAAHRSHPMATAWRSVQRAIVRFATAKADSAGGLKLARALAMATYRSPGEFAKRFSSLPTRIDGHFEFPVEQYLMARGDAYAQGYLAASFVCLSESIDLHNIDPATVTTPTTLVAVAEDQLVPLSDMQALAAGLSGPVQLIEMSSLYGHDAFLKETAALTSAFAPLLTGDSSS